MLTTNQKGAIAETAITHVAVKLGIGVFRPVADERYDLIFDLRPQLLRVQCKWAVKLSDVVLVRCRSCRRNRDGLVHRSYSRQEIDAIAAYCAELGTCYLLPAELATDRTGVLLRLRPARNNQRSGINWAKDFEFAATLSHFGAIAQLGERLSGTQKVAGSSPAGSTEPVVAQTSGVTTL